MNYNGQIQDKPRSGRIGVYSIPVFSLLFLSLFLLGCAGEREYPGVAGDYFRSRRVFIYPAWFLRPPSDLVTAVGYGRPMDDPDKERMEALLDGCANLLRQRRTVVSGGVTGFRVGKDASGIVMDGLEEAPVEDDLEAVASGVRILCEFSGPEGTLVLVSPSSAEMECDTIVDTRHMAPPEWIEELPREDGFIFAVGVSEDTYSERAGWLVAERNMRKELALSLEIKTMVLVKQQGGTGSLLSDNLLENPVVLRGIKILGRWKDPDSGNRFVLGKMPL